MINENTAVSLSLVSFIGGVIFFGASLYVNAQHQAAEIQRINNILEMIQRDEKRKEIRLQESHLVVAEKLAAIESKLAAVEKWCKELIEDKRKRSR